MFIWTVLVRKRTDDVYHAFLFQTQPDVVNDLDRVMTMRYWHSEIRYARETDIFVIHPYGRNNNVVAGGTQERQLGIDDS